MISEREVSHSVRRTRLQADRLARLAKQRIHEIGTELASQEDCDIDKEGDKVEDH